MRIEPTAPVSEPPKPEDSLRQERPAVPVLSTPQVDLLREARSRGEPLRRAATVATCNGWTLCVCAGVLIAIGLGNFATFALGLVIGLGAFVEFRGASRLRRLDRSATRALATNHLCLGITLIGFAVFVSSNTTALVAAAITVAGAMTLYYRSRQSHIERFIRQTPTWIVALYQAGILR